MNNTITGVLFLIVALGLSGCASSGKNTRVVETESGKLQAVAAHEHEADAAIDAIDAANDFCENDDKRAVFSEEELNKEKSKPTAGERIEDIIRRVPVVGETLGGDDKIRVAVAFRCQ